MKKEYFFILVLWTFAFSLVHEAFREAAVSHVIYRVGAVEGNRLARFNGLQSAA